MISNALPVQFWEAGEQTFNDKEVCGINQFCWCQPWQCDDEISFQFEDSVISAATLKVIDEDGNTLLSQAFTESNNLFSTSFIPNEEGICDEVVTIAIETNTADSTIFNVQFGSALSPFYNDGTGDEPWYWDGFYGGAATLEFSPTSTTSQQLRIDISCVEGFYRLDSHLFWLSLTGTTLAQSTGKLTIEIYNDDELIHTILSQSNTVPVSDSDADIELVSATNFVALEPFNKLVVTGERVSSDINFFYMGSSYLTLTRTSTIGYKSDCLDIKTEQPCTNLITYYNNSDFAGLIFEGTPVPQFKIRVPSVFFHEQNPMEEEVHPLSDDEWVRVWSRMERKIKFEIGYVPYYMHQKLQLILMHDNIEIDGLQWKKRDPYELVDGDKRFPMKRANVLLTDKDFIKRNLI